MPDPEEHITLDDLTDLPEPSVSPTSGGNPSLSPSYFPYPNENSYLLGNWFWNTGAKNSQESFRQLIKIVGDPRFCPEDVRATPWQKINKSLAVNQYDMASQTNTADDSSVPEWLSGATGWKKTPIEISVPFHRKTAARSATSHVVADLYHRPIVSVIRDRLSSPHPHFHYQPYALHWSAHPSLPEHRVHGELYTSAAFLEAHRRLQCSPPEPDCNLERVVVALMFWSDATHLTSVGTAKLWPSYLFFGNDSKYRRGKPSQHLCNHIAYFQSLQDAFKDFATENLGRVGGPTSAWMAHCRRELMHAQWRIILDEEFVEAYRHGIVVLCWDGVRRRFYPRVFTYSADYPEKVLIATLRDNGACPRCLIPVAQYNEMGTPEDMTRRQTLVRRDSDARATKVVEARSLIYDGNWAIGNKQVDALLKSESLVPTINAFSDILRSYGLDVFVMLVIDLMHEFELGVWKAVLLHLLRIVQAAGTSKLLHELDRRFRALPSFGQDTIRRFHKNVSELKSMTAREFEDVLQCSIPVFEGLLPEPHNTDVMRLLFTCAHWHALAKLRMHTDLTLALLEAETARFGDEMRHFKDVTCQAFNTVELPFEVDRRRRQQSKKTNAPSRPSEPTGTDRVQHTPRLDATVPAVATTKKVAAKSIAFSLSTYKYHALGDYPSTIRQFGTTDSFSTEIGELEHRTSKSRYPRTDRKNYVEQMAQIERRQHRLRQVQEMQGIVHEQVPKSMVKHHHIGESEATYVYVAAFLRRNAGDPAVKDFYAKLKGHLLHRIRHAPTEPPSFTDDNAAYASDALIFQHERIYTHSLMRINYTTYDVRRAQDIISHAANRNNIMVLTHRTGEDPWCHPFAYAQVLGIYHVNAYVPGSTDPRPQRMEFLWVRWYRLWNPTADPLQTRRLDEVSFPPVTDADAFGFLDPTDVIRSCYLEPAFAHGQRHSDGKGLSHCSRDGSDYNCYYVQRFVDRDMVMRYHWGLAVGHVYAHSNPPFNPGLSVPMRAPRAPIVDTFVATLAHPHPTTFPPNLAETPGADEEETLAAGSDVEDEDSDCEDGLDGGENSEDDDLIDSLYNM